MQITTIRLPESMKEAIEAEAEEQELSPTEYMRTILRNRKQITMEHSAEDSEGDYAELEDRLRELEQRVSKLESEPVDTETDTEATESDVVQWVQSNQPVSKSDIIAACYPSDSPLNERSWWDTRAREELKDSGFEHVRNVGWMIDE